MEADARRLREEFDNRSITKREEADRKREELLAARPHWPPREGGTGTDRQQFDEGWLQEAVDGIRAEMDACRKKAEELLRSA